MMRRVMLDDLTLAENAEVREIMYHCFAVSKAKKHGAGSKRGEPLWMAFCALTVWAGVRRPDLVVKFWWWAMCAGARIAPDPMLAAPLAPDRGKA